jgi:hypothetical protein
MTEGTQERVGENTPGRNMDIRALVAVCRAKAFAATEGHVRSIDLLHDALAATLELANLLDDQPDPGQALSHVCEEHAVKMDGRTKNRFIPLLKIVFDNSHDRSNIGRNAAALKYAADRQITPDQLPAFYKSNGGVAKCAGLEAQERQAQRHSSPAVSSKIQTLLGSRRQDAPKLDLPGTVAPPVTGFFSVLIERGADGECHILGTSTETERSLRRYFASTS